MKKNLLYLLLMVFNWSGYAQVGINNDVPDSYAILDLKSSNKGVLIPRMNSSERDLITNACKPNCPHGLMVFDTDKKAFFYFFKNKWYLINPFTAPDATNGSPENMATNDLVVSSIGIGKTPQYPYKLDINGNYQVSGKSNYDTLVNNKGITVKTGNLIDSTGDILVKKGKISVTTGKVHTKTFTSDINEKGKGGPVPKGGIVIWSGTIANIPVGWAICDGQKGTPDLRERFVVGAGNSYAVNDVGGEVTHVLTTNEMPSHTHTGNTNVTGGHQHTYKGYRVPEDYDCAGCHRGRQTKSKDKNSGHPEDYGGEYAGSHTHTVTIDNTGSDTAHENRPPYYALAYIMKL